MLLCSKATQRSGYAAVTSCWRGAVSAGRGVLDVHMHRAASSSKVDFLARPSISIVVATLDSSAPSMTQCKWSTTQCKSAQINEAGDDVPLLFSAHEVLPSSVPPSSARPQSAVEHAAVERVAVERVAASSATLSRSTVSAKGAQLAVSTASERRRCSRCPRC